MSLSDKWKGVATAVLALLLLPVLKLCGLLDWPWWAASASLWLPFALLVLFVIAMGILFMLLMVKFFFEDYKDDEEDCY